MTDPKGITDLLDQLEKVLVAEVVALWKAMGKEIDDNGARNVLAKVGSRIMYRDSIGKERVDEILMGK